MPRPRFVANRITMQDNPRDFLPIRTFCFRIEKTPIGDVVLFVVGRNVVPARRFVIHIGIEVYRHSHGHSPYREGLSAVRPRKHPL